MADPLTKHEYFGDFSDVYDVVRTVVVVKHGQRYRIEVMKSYANFHIPYTASCWIERETMWVRYDRPAVVEYNAEKALEAALTSLG